MKKAAIIGAGGHALVIKSILLLNKNIVVESFIDKDGEDKKLEKIKKGLMAVSLGVGDNKVRAELFKKVKKMEIEIIPAIHPSAIISPDAVLGEGVVICAGAIICTKAVIGDNSIINTGATIDHETRIGKNCHIAPGVHIAGKVVVRDNTLVGIGVSVIPNIKIGKNVVIGAGAVVIDDVPNDSLAAGVPAKVIKKL